MSDYMYILESHLSPDQNRVVEAVQAAAGEAGVNVFLTGGAMRDMLAGFPIRDLDFVVEGNALKVAHAIGGHGGARTVHLDEARKTADLLFPSGVTAQIAMSRQEKYGRGGARPSVVPATIQEDLRGRDFTCNAIALSLNRASRGLLLDPMNGLADIERRELRAVSTYGFYDDPSRLLRLVRLSVRLGFAVEERTRMQLANAREAEVETRIPPRSLSEELRRISAEDRPGEILKGLEEAGLLKLFSPVLGSKLNHQALARLEKAEALVPDDAPWRAARFGVFMQALTAGLAPKEKAALIKTTEMPKSDLTEWQKLETRAKKLESALKSARIRKASHVYQAVSAAAPDEILFTLCHSALKPVQERLRNHFGKYLAQIAE
ncbi:MAG: CCA tRNA nucleotidyltransferase, partial [Acidobacteriota bacterium]|nr:CCA tRNA nucleotidyltransferase [Acidobacteriota bacterium]